MKNDECDAVTQGDQMNDSDFKNDHKEGELGGADHVGHDGNHQYNDTRGDHCNSGIAGDKNKFSLQSILYG